MRRLGTELGVDPMAIYHHVSHKSALFDGLIELVYAAIELPEATAPWDDYLRATTRSLRSTFLAHPNVIALLGTRPPITPAAFDVVETVAGVLLAAGFTAQQAADGVDCLARLVIGHALTEAGRPPGGEVSGGEQEHIEARAQLPPSGYPSLASIERAGIRHDPNRLFELSLKGLILVLEGQLHPSP